MNYSDMDLASLEHKIIWVQGLMIQCPLGKPLDNCPANEVRLLPISERLDIVKKMEEHDLDGIIAHHKECLMRRERLIF